MNNVTAQKPKRHYKAWGWEDWIVNNTQYCAKILHFYGPTKFSLHFHLDKHETWYVANGSFLLIYIDTRDGSRHSLALEQGDTIEIPQGFPHQLYTEKGGDIFETSTHHEDRDSYRVEPGDSQKEGIVVIRRAA